MNKHIFNPMKITTFTRSLQITLLMLILSSAAWAQTPTTYQCSVRNDSLLTSKIYEFDLYLLDNDPVNIFELGTFQAGIVVNSAMINGGIISASLVAGSSQLVAAQVPSSVTFTALTSCIKLAPKSGPGSGSATIISSTSPGTRVIRIRLTNTVNFGQVSPNFVFNFTSSPYNTIVSAYDQTSLLNINITNEANHTVLTMTNPVLNLPVLAYNMTGGGNYCLGGSGMLVGLDGSQSGVQYKLVKNTVPVGANIPGTGSAISFGLQTAGTYTSTAYRKATYLTGTMTGSATVTLVTVVPTISGLATACAGSGGVVYTTESGKSNYLWTVSAGGTITSGGTVTDNTATITWNTAGAQSVSVNYTDAGCTAASATVYPVTVNAQPVPTLSGTNNLCAGTTGVVYTTQAGQSTYVWTVSAGGTITSGGTSSSNTVTVTWNTAGAQTVSVNYTNASGCTASTAVVYSVTVNATPVPSISGNNNLCVGTADVVYTTQSGQSDYIWSVSAGGTITAGGTVTDNTITITWDAAGAQTVSVNYNNALGCSAAAPVVYPVTVIAVPVPSVSGLASVCQATSGVVYTTQTGKSAYSWSVSAGGTITAGGTATDNTVTITWNTVGAQTVSVNYSNGICSAASPTVYNVTVNARPAPTISGPAQACTGSTVVYSTQAGMTNYVWTVSAGGTITSGGTSADNTASIHWTTTGAQTVSINYTNASSCAASSAVVYNVTVATVFNPGISGNNAPCVGATGVVYTTEPGNSNYAWVVSAGGTITAGGSATDILLLLHGMHRVASR